MWTYLDLTNLINYKWKLTVIKFLLYLFTRILFFTLKYIKEFFTYLFESQKDGKENQILLNCTIIIF